LHDHRRHRSRSARKDPFCQSGNQGYG
jgi:hypothetical protein